MVGPLRSLLTKLAFRRSIGLYIGDEQVTLARVAHTPLGLVETSVTSRPYAPDRLAEVLAEAFAEARGGKKTLRDQVFVGLPVMRVFFAAKALKPSEQDVKAATLLVELFQSPNVNYDDMELDIVKEAVGKQSVARAVTSRKSYLTGLYEAIDKAGVRPQRAEPAAIALLREAERRHRAPRKAKHVLRLFLGDGQGLAVVASRGGATTWRVFALPTGGEPAAVRSLVASMALANAYDSLAAAPEALMIHGRPDLASTLGAEEFVGSLPLVPAIHPGPGYTPEAIAAGLVGGQNDAAGFDLFRKLKSRPPVWEVIPFGEIVVQVGLVACLTMYLQSQADAVRTSYRQTRAEASEHAWMSKVADDKLDKEKKELEAKVEAVRQFLDTRILWTAYTKDLSARLPETLMLRAFTGVSEFEAGPKASKAKKSIQFSVAAPIQEGVSVPPEIVAYLDDLRHDPLLKRDFPNVELADLRRARASTGKTSMAEFAISCLPKTDKKPAGAAAPKASEH